jgi:hypothetical protein
VRFIAPIQLLFGADDFCIPPSDLEEVEAHTDDLTLDGSYGRKLWMSPLYESAAYLPP